MQKLRISIIGAGNVGYHLANALYKSGHSVLQIYSRNLQTAQNISENLHSEAINSLSLLNPSADLLILCVSDSAIPELVNQINFQPKLIVHTAGSVSIKALNKFENRGVFYPMQTFSKNVSLDFGNIPLCIEADSPENLSDLRLLAQSLSKAVYELSSEKRLQCHLAAVFANNFSNHMFAIAESLMLKNDIPFDILKPIIMETALKVQQVSPLQAQTGPASRNDTATLQKHQSLLDAPDLEKIYSFVSQSILNYKLGAMPEIDIAKNNE